jgi:hypothetical protein
MNCPECGGVIDSPQRFCDDCGAQVIAVQQAETTGTAVPVPVLSPPPVVPPAAAPATSAATPIPVTPIAATELTPRTLPGTPIRLADGERIWRQYHVSKLATAKQGEGVLYVTDARVVYYARARGRGTQRPSALVQQTKIEHITGVQAYVSKRLSLLLVALSGFFGLLAVVSLFGKFVLPAIVFLALTALCVTILVVEGAKRGSVGVTIYSRAAGPSPIHFGRYGRRGFIGASSSLSRPLLALFGVFTAFDVLLGFPGPDAETVIAELGALILDLQTRGDLAAEHWVAAPAGGVAAGVARAR